MNRAFEGKIALVTGGGTGIGAAITARLADDGAAVLICQRTQEEAEGAMAQLARPGRALHAFGGDLATPGACRQAVEHCVSVFGGVDILVNNAAVTGAPALGPFLEFTDEHLNRIIDLNLKGPFRLGREAAKRMLDRGGGVIVNITSVAAVAGQEFAAAYTASKAGLSGLTKAMALELAPYGIRVVAVAPGDIHTEASARFVDELTNAGASGRYVRVTPLGRRGRPEEIAAAVAFVCSHEGSFITGSTITVDGGFLSY